MSSHSDNVDKEVKQLNKEIVKAYVDDDSERQHIGDRSHLTQREAQSLDWQELGEIENQLNDSDEVEVQIHDHTAVATSPVTDSHGELQYVRVYVKQNDQWQFVAAQVKPDERGTNDE